MMKEISDELDGVIAKMLKPLKDLKLGLVIEGISGCRVVPFKNKNVKDRKILDTLVKMADNVISEINKTKIIRKRANEVGNDIEIFVKESLNRFGYKAKTPSIKSGKSKSPGYPDLEFIDEFGQINYLECKTYNKNNISTSFRSFYLSPSKNFKITKNAHHFGISFEIITKRKSDENNIYNAIDWKILDLSQLKLDLKYEFNASNKKLYSKELIIAEKS